MGWNSVEPGSLMNAATQLAPVSNTARRTGYVLSGIAVLFMLFDAVVKIVKAVPAVQGTVQLGYSAGVVQPLGFVVLVLVILYVVPRTAVFGAVLLTGYLGGAVASQVRVGNPWPTQILFPVYVAVLLWGSLYLRDARVRAVVSRNQAN